MYKLDGWNTLTNEYYMLKLQIIYFSLNKHLIEIAANQLVSFVV